MITSVFSKKAAWRRARRTKGQSSTDKKGTGTNHGGAPANVIQLPYSRPAREEDVHVRIRTGTGLINSPSAINTSSTAGVAFLLNRKFIDVDHVQVFQLDPGRALLISVPGHKGQTMNILNIYAPNTPRDRDELWIRLWTQWKGNPRLPLPDVVLRDWNFIEDPRDRFSARKETVSISFNRLKSLFQMEDGWRNTFPDDRQGEEQLGKGRFSLPLYLLKTRKFTEEVHRLGKVLKADCEKLKDIPRCSEDNIQKLWEQFKLDTIEYAKNCSLIVESEMTKKLRTWKAQLYLIIHDTSMGADDRNLLAYLLEKKINDYLKERAQEQKDSSQARYDLEAETLHSSFWTKSATGYHMKESIHEFTVPLEPVAAPRQMPTTRKYESRPKMMAELAREYHDKIQLKDQPDEYARILTTSMVLEKCDARLSNGQHDSMRAKIPAYELTLALKLSKNGSAPGIDGLPYEFYKWLQIKNQARLENDSESWDILEILQDKMVLSLHQGQSDKYVWRSKSSRPHPTRRARQEFLENSPAATITRGAYKPLASSWSFASAAF
ncbi:hypothetical protein B0H19DRAFT_1083798 [Mycena capillaripes]|nr:hypothetical protein B0H19DRAFT_1083798 [Mycena capillaripes]